MPSDIELVRPRTLPEALEEIARLAPNCKPLAGGTNIVAELRDGHHSGKTLVDLTRLEELRGIRVENGYLVLGGGVTITELLTHPLVAAHGAALRESAAVFANPLVRNRATLSGNLVDASPAADTAPPLLALGAQVELVSQNSARWVALEDFLVGVRKTLLQPDEIMLSIRWELPSARAASAFHKVGLRKADAISVLSTAVFLETDADGVCAQARIALGAVAPRPFLARRAASLMIGRRVDAAVIASAASQAAAETRPISDIRGAEAYRRRVTEVTVRRLLAQVLEAL
ncbi:MAG: FAD binding domain-containing protein [Chloroflexi bacterium]|nr:FAD binding domain-containing protein [Chloroflexota bacterium]